MNKLVRFRTQYQDEREMIRKILFESYGLSLKSYKRLEGYDDVNYHVTVFTDDNLTKNPIQKDSTLREGYVLRVFNARDSSQPQRMEAINNIIIHAQEKGILTKATLPNLQGKSISLWTLMYNETEKDCVVCLRPFLPGKMASEFRWTPSMLFKYGVFVANVTKALEDLSHPFFENFHFSWDVENVVNLKEKLERVEDCSRQSLIREALSTLSTELFKHRQGLKIGQIHGDIGITNIVFPSNSDIEGDEDFSRWGLIDFHDTHRTVFLNELAIAACHTSHMKIQDTATRSISPLEVMAFVVDGYRSVIAIGHSGREYLIASIKARLCTLILNSYHELSLCSENREYITRLLEPHFELLQELHLTSTKDISKILFERHSKDN